MTLIAIRRSYLRPETAQGHFSPVSYSLIMVAYPLPRLNLKLDVRFGMWSLHALDSSSLSAREEFDPLVKEACTYLSSLIIFIDYSVRSWRFILPSQWDKTTSVFSRVDNSNTSIGKRCARNLNVELGTPFGVTFRVGFTSSSPFINTFSRIVRWLDPLIQFIYLRSQECEKGDGDGGFKLTQKLDII